MITELAFLKDLRQKARHIAFDSAFYHWSLGGSAPDGLTTPPADAWPGDAAQGRWLCDTFAAFESTYTSGMQNFDALRDLRTLGGDEARRVARAMIEGWSRRNRRWHADSWAPDLIGRRVANWLALYGFYGASADENFQELLADSLIRQSRHLARTIPGNCHGLCLLYAIKGLAAAGLAFHGRESWLEQALDLLQVETARQILPDGGHVTRSPQALLEVLRIVMDIRVGLAGCGYPVPEQLVHTIDRMAQALRFFRYPDKGFACFNGANEGDRLLIDSVQLRTNAHGRILHHLPHTQYERLTLGRSLIMLDAGAPPPRPFDEQAHAAPLAFEFIYGKERLFVNCGTHPADVQWRDALRGTAAHNTLTLDSRNAAEIREDDHFGRKSRAIQVTREESRDAILVEGAHDGYVPLNGITHRRRLYLTDQGHDLRGEDTLTCAASLSKPAEIAIRFHLHPRVQVSLVQNGEEALLKLHNGAGWRFSQIGGSLSLDNSIYTGSGEPQARKTKQLVITAETSGAPTQLKWALRRESF